MAFAFTETLTIIRPDAPVFPTMGDAPTTTSTDVSGCISWPTATSELVFGQDTVIWDREAVFPAGTDIKATDQVERLGVIYDVSGRPQHWESPFTGSRPGIVVQLKSATG